MIIDMHNHIGLSGDGGHGKLAEILSNMDKFGVEKSVVFAIDEQGHHPMYSPENDKILDAQDQHPDKIIAFARIVPSDPNLALKELKRCCDRGAKGLKLKTKDGFHPRDAIPLFEFIKNKKNFPVLMHTDHEHRACKPSTWSKYIRKYPQIDFIMAHGGKADCRVCGKIAKDNPNAYAETSTISLHRTRLIYEIAGAEKMIFASDYPYSHLAVELQKYEILVHDAFNKELIFYKNAQKILGI